MQIYFLVLHFSRDDSCKEIDLLCQTSNKPHLHLPLNCAVQWKWAREDKSNSQVEKVLWFLNDLNLNTAKDSQSVVRMGLSTRSSACCWRLYHSELHLHMSHSFLPYPVTDSHFFWAETSIDFHFWVMSAEIKKEGCLLLLGQISCIHIFVISLSWLILFPTSHGLSHLSYSIISSVEFNVIILYLCKLSTEK